MNVLTHWIVFTMVAVGSLIACWGFALNLLPSVAEAQEAGTYVPWIISWTMIWMVTLSAIALAGFLIKTGSKGLPK